MSTKLRVFQTHQDGDLLLRFVLEPDSHDTELAEKFGDPEIEVGGTYFEAATLAPPVIAGGVIQSVAILTPGSDYVYSPQRPLEIEAEGTTGSGATFSATLTPAGRLNTLTVVSGGSNYSDDTVVRIVKGDHVTYYPPQKVKLWSGFPFTRRINTIAPGDATLPVLTQQYVAQIQTNVETALAALRALDNPTTDLTKEIVYQP